MIYTQTKYLFGFLSRSFSICLVKEKNNFPNSDVHRDPEKLNKLSIVRFIYFRPPA